MRARIDGKVTTVDVVTPNSRDHLNVEHGIPDPEALHKVLFEYLDPRSTNALMSRNTLKSDKYFQTAKATIKNICHSLGHESTLSFDL